MAGQLPPSIRILVTDSHGNPASGASVLFSTKSGTVTPTRARTDSAGRAQVRWTLGARAGEQVVDVALKDSGVRVSARVRAVAPRRAR